MHNLPFESFLFSEGLNSTIVWEVHIIIPTKYFSGFVWYTWCTACCVLLGSTEIGRCIKLAQYSLFSFLNQVWARILSVLSKITIVFSVGILGRLHQHIWELPVLCYHKIMVIYPSPFLVVINQFFSCIICINDCICILTGLPG